MRRLIINADDLGISEQRSHGIFLAYEHGVLQSTSLLTNFPHSAIAARHAAERDMPTGLHLNLTEYAPLSTVQDIASLLTTDGFFLGHESLLRNLRENTVEPLHIERELQTQIEWFLEIRGQPTHIDSHHHMHIHPQILPVLLPLLDHYGITFIRIPEEPPEPFGYQIDPKRSSFIAELSTQARTARELITAHGFQTSDHFRGLALGGSASMRNLRHTLGRLPVGTTELMMHPGSPSSSSDMFDSDPQRQTELNILLADDTRKELAEREIVLCSYADLF